MAKILHEYWEDEGGADVVRGGDFGPVSDEMDRLRPILTPNSRKIFDLRAASWFEAMRLHNERLGFGDYVPPEGIEDHFYTDEEAVSQKAYLKVRNVL